MQLKKILFSPVWLGYAIRVGLGVESEEGDNKPWLGPDWGGPQMQRQGVRADLLGDSQKPRVGGGAGN